MPTLVRPKAKPKDGPTRQSDVWHVCFWDRLRGRTRLISTQCRQRRNAERRLREFVDLLEQGRYTGANPWLAAQQEQAKAHQTLALPALLSEYEADLRAGRVRKRGRGKPPTAEYAALALTRLRRCVAGVTRADALTPEAVTRTLDRLCEDGGLSRQTRKHHERAVKAFAAWLCSSGRLPHDPLAGLSASEVTTETTAYPRGAFSPEQVSAIVASAKRGPTYRGLSGPQRSLLWLFLAATGLRVREAASVRRCDFGPGLLSVTVAGCHTKNGKEARQPLPPWLAVALSPYVATLGETAYLWPGGWRQDAKGRWVVCGWVGHKDAGELLRRDAKGCGILIGKEGLEANGGVALDAHSFRHTFATNLGRCGVSERLARKLTRTSSESLLARYTHTEQAELAAAVAALPSLLVE